MKLISFRITNYKSIVDSTECRVSSDFTTLIGKNESGKTAILEAIRDFDKEQYVIPQEAYPLSSINEEPSLEMTFLTNKEELDAIEKDSETTLNEDIRQLILQEGICLTKSAMGEYNFKNEYLRNQFNTAELPEAEVQETSCPIRNIKKQLNNALSGYSVPQLIIDRGPEALDLSLKEIKLAVKGCLNLIPEEQKREEVVELVHSLIREANNSHQENQADNPKVDFFQCVLQRLPRFILFSDFKDILPFEISASSLMMNTAVRDFARIANLDLEKAMKTQDLQRRINLLSRHSAKISGDFLSHWDQDEIELIVRPEGDKLLFGVKETAKTDFYKVEQRSKGFQWFLSFYLRLNSYKSDNVVLLIDEPGINLHPTAQMDILKILEEYSSQDATVIFSTHSSALIDTDKLERVRLVIKDKNHGSFVTDQINNDVDSETLMPITTALGAKLSLSLPIIEKTEEIRIDENDEEEVPEIEEESKETQTLQELIDEENQQDSTPEIEPAESLVFEPIDVEPVLQKAQKRRGLFGLFSRKEEVSSDQEKAPEEALQDSK